MKRWRVGSLSMGISLVAVGVLLLVSLFTNLNFITAARFLWPIILVALGVEMLLKLFFIKEEDVRIRYDGLSIFFLIIMLTISTGAYAVNMALNVFDSKPQMLSAMGIWTDCASVEGAETFEGASSLSLTCLSGGSLHVLPAQGSNIRAEYVITANTNDAASAREALGGVVRAIQGDAAALYTNDWSYGRNTLWGRPSVCVTVLLPPGKTLHINDFYGSVFVSDACKGQVTGTMLEEPPPEPTPPKSPVEPPLEPVPSEKPPVPSPPAMPAAPF